MQPFQVRVLQLLEDLPPYALTGPAVEASPDGVPVAEALGQVAPGGPGFGDPKDGIDEEAFVPGGDAGQALASGQEILDAVPVLVADGVAVVHGSLDVPAFSAPIYSGLLYNCPHDPRSCPVGNRTYIPFSSQPLSRSSGRPVVFGDTSTGKHLIVVYEEIDAAVYPITAYEVPRR